MIFLAFLSLIVVAVTNGENAAEDDGDDCAAR